MFNNFLLWIVLPLYCFLSLRLAVRILSGRRETKSWPKRGWASVCFLLGAMMVWPLVYHYEMRRLNNHQKIEANRRQEGWRKEREEREQEQARRAQLRKEWIAANKPKLYYNTVSGVTAVLRPADYDACQKDTKRSRRNGFWEKNNILLPARQTFVFVVKQGEELIRANTGSDHVRRYKIAGWLSQLDEIIEKGEVELERKEDIFVPWVNESLVPFEQQMNTLQDCFSSGSYFDLIEKQAPVELHPLQ